MLKFTHYGIDVASSDCKICGKGVCVKVRPMPNDIDVGGEAVAVGCRDRGLTMSKYDEQAAEFLRKTNTSLDIKFVGAECPLWENGKHIHGDKYLVTLTRGSRSYAFDFWNSFADKQKGVKPCAYNVLACIDGCCPETFKEFCSDYGYGEDSIKGEKTFRAVQDQVKGLMSLFSDKELEILAEIA